MFKLFSPELLFLMAKKKKIKFDKNKYKSITFSLKTIEIAFNWNICLWIGTYDFIEKSSTTFNLFLAMHWWLIVSYFGNRSMTVLSKFSHDEFTEGFWVYTYSHSFLSHIFLFNWIKRSPRLLNVTLYIWLWHIWTKMFALNKIGNCISLCFIQSLYI